MSGSFLKNKRGFSLVELMVVVAIIGILASIAIPSIGRYMAKARQSEAKANLSSMYTAQKAFLAEYNTYTGIFEVIGFTPEGNLRYNIGYGGVGVAFATLATYGYTAAAPPTSSFDAANYCNTGNNNLCTTLADATAVALAGFTNPTNSAFVAAAQGRIKNNSTSTNGVDQWRIDEAKNITNNIDGTQ